MTDQEPTDRVAATQDSSHRSVRTIVAVVLVLAFAAAYLAVIAFYRTGFNESFAPPTPPSGELLSCSRRRRLIPRREPPAATCCCFCRQISLTRRARAKFPATRTVPSPEQEPRWTMPSDRSRAPSQSRCQHLDCPAVSSRHLRGRIHCEGCHQRSARTWRRGSHTVVHVLPSTGLEPERRLDDAGECLGGDHRRVDCTFRFDKVVAALMLILMVALAIIAVLVVQSSASGRMRLELNVASWITAMLFALLPIRGFLPGDPPIGSWIDILVFFWSKQPSWSVWHSLQPVCSCEREKSDSAQSWTNRE